MGLIGWQNAVHNQECLMIRSARTHIQKWYPQAVLKCRKCGGGKHQPSANLSNPETLPFLSYPIHPCSSCKIVALWPRKETCTSSRIPLLRTHSWARNGAASVLRGSRNVFNNLESAQMPGILMQAHAKEAKVMPVQSTGLIASGCAVKGFLATICFTLASSGNNRRGGWVCP